MALQGDEIEQLYIPKEDLSKFYLFVKTIFFNKARYYEWLRGDNLS